MKPTNKMPADRLLPGAGPALAYWLREHGWDVAAATFTELFHEVVNTSVTVRSHEGWGAGREAADRARLGE